MSGTFKVMPLVYDGKEYDYQVRADWSGETGIYEEMAVLIERISDGKPVADIYIMIDRESGEPCILITSDGEGLGDHAIRVFPMRPKEKMVEEER